MLSILIHLPVKKNFLNNPDTDYLSAKDLRRVTDSLQTKVHKYFKQKAYSWTPVDYDESKAIVYLAAR